MTREDVPQPLMVVNPSCFHGFDPWVAYRNIPATGIRHVEVPSFPGAAGAQYDLTTFAPEAFSRDDIDLIRGRLRDLGLIPLTVGAYCNVLDPREIDALRARIDFAQLLGASYVITDACTEEQARNQPARVVNAMRWAADYAEERGIRLALEIHQGPTRNGRELRKFLDVVDHPNLGVNYDTGNIYYYNEGVDPAEDIKEIVDRVIHVHLKDTRGGFGEWAFCNLGDGRVRFPEILAELDAVGYSGPYSLEIEGSHGEDPNCAAILQRIHDSLEYLRSIGMRC
jgi:L-ribulose-5-phosphate 3-epimerase